MRRHLGQRDALPGEINGDALDRFTIGHGAVGVLMGLGRMPWWGALTVAIGWEFVERGLKEAIPAAFPNATQDTTSNAIFDSMAMMLGWTAVQLFPPDKGR